MFNIVSVWWQWIFILLFIVIDFYFLTKACEQLPTGTVYAIFAAVGTLGTALMDIFIFSEPMSRGKALFMIILVIGVISLKMADRLEAEKALRGIK